MDGSFDKPTPTRAERHPEKAHRPDNPIQRKPDWIRVRAPNSPEYAETKRLMREGQGMSFDAVMEMSAAMQSLAHLTRDHQEAVAAFFDKRNPEYKGE